MLNLILTVKQTRTSTQTSRAMMTVKSMQTPMLKTTMIRRMKPKTMNCMKRIAILKASVNWRRNENSTKTVKEMQTRISTTTSIAMQTMIQTETATAITTVIKKLRRKLIVMVKRKTTMRSNKRETMTVNRTNFQRLIAMLRERSTSMVS